MQTRRIYPTLLATFLFFLPLFSSGQTENDWELKRDKGGIRVYMREVEGSKIKELKFETEIDASLNAVAAILMNVEGFDDWVYASKLSEPIQWVNDQEVYYYTVIDFPWPLSDRDLVLHTRFWQDTKTLAIHSETHSVHWMKPRQEDLVRIEKANLSWVFTPIGRGRIQVNYYLNSDPAGNIPAWMINLAADQGPLQTMIRFKDEIAKDKYRQVKLAFVQEID